jgi:indolepyruvate ferredoxin oxidoreductase alpha subunit
VKPNPDPLRTTPVTTILEDCVGCGLCGELAHAAQLCPSFYEAEVVQNPGAWERLVDRIRRSVIGALAESAGTAPGT